uniref:Translation initiation factor eIF2B subunit alpha n=1 Tax=Arcella intermedia TaxID=1963864 RepID=A0A6B2LBD4_9EUKA
MSKSMTLLHLNRDLDIAREALCRQNNSIAVQSLCDLFKKYVTRTWDDLQNFALLKEKLIKRGEQFKVNTEESTAKIAKNGSSFIRDGMTVLTHGYSTVVLNLLTTAKEQGKRFSVYVTETRPADQSYKTVDALLEKKIPTTIIADTTVAHIMSDIDLVLVGAAHVVENGGVLNEVGTYQLSIVAKTFRKPFYVAAQSFKFTRKLYPLNQKEIPDNEALLQENHFITDLKKKYPSLQVFRPSLDYTPPSYLTLLFTDLGVLTPSAVSDELIKLYT